MIQKISAVTLSAQALIYVTLLHIDGQSIDRIEGNRHVRVDSLSAKVREVLLPALEKRRVVTHESPVHFILNDPDTAEVNIHHVFRRCQMHGLTRKNPHDENIHSFEKHLAYNLIMRMVEPVMPILHPVVESARLTARSYWENPEVLVAPVIVAAPQLSQV